MGSFPDDPHASSPASEAPQSPRVVLPDEDVGDAFDEPLVPEPPPSLVRSIVWASGLGLVGAIGWAAITLITDYQLGLIAIVVGALAGIGAAKGGRGTPAQVVGAVCAAGSYFLGQFIIVMAMVIGQAPAGFDDSEAPAFDPPPAAVDTSADPNAGEIAAAVPPAEVAADADGDYGAPVDGESPLGLFAAIIIVFAMIVSETFTSGMSLLFLGIAIYEGWKIPRVEDG